MPPTVLQKSTRKSQKWFKSQIGILCGNHVGSFSGGRDGLRCGWGRCRARCRRRSPRRPWPNRPDSRYTWRRTEKRFLQFYTAVYRYGCQISKIVEEYIYTISTLIRTLSKPHRTLSTLNRTLSISNWTLSKSNRTHFILNSLFFLTNKKEYF